MNIVDEQERTAILSVIHELRRASEMEQRAMKHTACSAEPSPRLMQPVHHQRSEAGTIHAYFTSVAGGSRSCVDKTKRTGCITDFFARKRPRAPQAPAGVVSHGKSTKASELNEKGFGSLIAKPLPTMRIPGTRFLVDAFRCREYQCDHWFLTHFHSDRTPLLSLRYTRGNLMVLVKQILN